MVSFLLAQLCFAAALVNASPSHQSKPYFNWDDTNFILAFGDSYTYVQGTSGRQNYSFIGDLQNYSFTPEKLLSDEIVQNQIGTSAGGPNWVEYLTGCFSGLPSRCKKQLWNFAFAGSDVSTKYTPLHHNYSVSFTNQIAQWNTYARPILPVTLSKSIVAVFIGINDISDSSKYTFPRANASDFPSFYNQIINTEFEALDTVYQAGYRNFLFMNLPPLERTPGNVKPGITPLPNSTMLQTYNTLLSTATSTFATTHPGTKSMLFDTYSFLTSILDNPAPYGITNTTSFCPRYDAPDIETNYAAYGCVPLEQYFWYNSGHITWRVHGFLAGAVRGFLESEGY
ncbi:Acetylesterase [Lachnellula hyalina]|uniref:Acetylesterase n=1 Tax=Lachnellula hyalina TaxID=1316788 RepID=A0A8H8R9R3_9HELO|nr:Acetylesterase [Lachnellula hyalina]TVY31201.1 Acetylesterase [Lachnellula hyalina]